MVSDLAPSEQMPKTRRPRNKTGKKPQGKTPSLVHPSVLGKTIRGRTRRTFPPAILDKLFARLASGHSLITICREDPRMPSQCEVYFLAEDDPVFREKYMRAREFQAHGCFDLIMEKANDEEKDPQRLRIQIDALKWAASKLLPKKYGDKLEFTGDITFVPLTDLLAKAQQIRAREAEAFDETIDIESEQVNPPSLPAPQETAGEDHDHPNQH